MNRISWKTQPLVVQRSEDADFVFQTLQILDVQDVKGNPGRYSMLKLILISYSYPHRPSTSQRDYLVLIPF